MSNLDSHDVNSKAEETSKENLQNKPSSQTLAILFLCQGISFALMLVLTEVLTEFYIHLPFPVILAIQGLLAAFIGYIIGMAVWWVPIHFVMPALIAMAMTLNIPAWVYLVSFIIMVLVFWNSSDERVPLYLTNKLTWLALSERLSEFNTEKLENREGYFIDLGCGISGLLTFLAPRQTNYQFYGIESAPIPYAISFLRRIFNEYIFTLIYGNLWKTNLSQFDVVYCFLSPAPMSELFAKAKSEMKPGSLFVSNSFVVPDQFPDETIQVDDRRQTQLFVWHM